MICQVMHLLGDLGQMLADLHARRRGVDRLERAAVLLAVGLQVPDVEVAGAAAHPEHDAAPVGLAELLGVGLERREELDRRDAERRGGEVAHPVAPRHLAERPRCTSDMGSIAPPAGWGSIEAPASSGGEACRAIRARASVNQDELVGIQQGPEQVLQDLEAVRERFEILPGLGRALWPTGAG